MSRIRLMVLAWMLSSCGGNKAEPHLVAPLYFRDALAGPTADVVLTFRSCPDDPTDHTLRLECGLRFDGPWKLWADVDICRQLESRDESCVPLSSIFGAPSHETSAQDR